MNLIDKLSWRYATKRFDPERHISKEDLEFLKESIRLAPASYGLQSYKVLVISNKDIQRQLVEASYYQQQVADAPYVFVFCSMVGDDEKLIDDYMTLTAKIRHTPAEKLEKFAGMIRSKMQRLGDEGVREWKDRQCYIAMTHLLIACADRGIDACPMEGIIPSEYSRILGLEPKGLVPVLAVPVGYRHPDDAYASLPKVRKSPEDLFEEIK